MTILQRLSLLIFCSFLITGLFGQGWIRTYGSDADDEARDVIQMPDGGYVLTGTSNEDVFLVRTDVDGNVLWSKIYDNGSEEVGYFLTKSVYGGYYILANYFVPGTSGNFTNSELWLIRLDESGNMLWSETYGGLSYENPRGIMELPNGDVLMLCTTWSYGEGRPNITKVDNTGALIWDQPYLPLTFPDWTYSDAAGFVVDNEGSILVVGRHDAHHDFFLDSQVFLMKTNGDGDLLWYNRYGGVFEDGPQESGKGILAAPDGGYYIGGEVGIYNGPNFATRTWLAKVDAEGTLQWEQIPNQDGLRMTDMTLMPNGDLMAIGYTDTPPFLEGDNIFVSRYDPDGNPIWRNTYGQDEEDQVYTIISTPDGGAAIAGRKKEAPGVAFTDAILMKMDGNGVVFSNAIGGTVSQDSDNNCIADPSDYGLSSWIVMVEGTQTFYGVTNAEGEYLIDVTPGTYQVRAIPPVPYWETCLPAINSVINDFGDSITIDHVSQAIVDCPLLTVDISAAFLRRCFENTYHVNYCNLGTTLVEEAEVVITLDSTFSFINSSIPWTNQENQSYTFPVGELDVGECGHFTLTFYIDCDNTVLGQTHCTEAHIFPDSLCLDPSLDWDGSSLQVEATCIGDSIQVQVKNIGDGNMTMPSPFLVVEDNVMLFQGNVQLNSGADTLFTYAANGATLYFEVAQSPGHPGNDIPNVVIEGCGGFPFSIGFATQYPENDADPFISVDCQENIGAFDPNDKIGYPTGRGSANLIDKNQEIEYRIRFQNTGTDTAFNIHILDTLSSFMDITSIRPGAASHPYELDIIASNILRFSFKGIMLPDSNINEPASHGFIKFRIDQTPNNPIGTEISNSAGIYFDFNEPVITNQTVHRIGQPLMVSVEPDIQPGMAQRLKVFPNPFHESATFEFLEEVGSLQLELYDFSGRLLRQESQNGSQLQFKRNGLPPGIYFYILSADGTRKGSGKVLVQD